MQHPDTYPDLDIDQDMFDLFDQDLHIVWNIFDRQTNLFQGRIAPKISPC